MATREEAHEAIDRLYDRLDADGREPLGCVIGVPHAGPYPGLDHTTIETSWELLRHERTATVLHGAVAMLRLAVDDAVTKDAVPQPEALADAHRARREE